MRVTLDDVSGILNRTPDEILFIANTEKRLTAHLIQDNDMVYNEDGTVSFTDGITEQQWEFDLPEVLAFKKEMDEGLVGTVEGILEG